MKTKNYGIKEDEIQNIICKDEIEKIMFENILKDNQEYKNIILEMQTRCNNRFTIHNLVDMCRIAYYNHFAWYWLKTNKCEYLNEYLKFFQRQNKNNEKEM
jgi:hypothetical protein